MLCWLFLKTPTRVLLHWMFSERRKHLFVWTCFVGRKSWRGCGVGNLLWKLGRLIDFRILLRMINLVVELTHRNCVQNRRLLRRLLRPWLNRIRIGLGLGLGGWWDGLGSCAGSGSLVPQCFNKALSMKDVRLVGLLMLSLLLETSRHKGIIVADYCRLGCWGWQMVILLNLVGYPVLNNLHRFLLVRWSWFWDGTRTTIAILRLSNRLTNSIILLLDLCGLVMRGGWLLEGWVGGVTNTTIAITLLLEGIHIWAESLIWNGRVVFCRRLRERCAKERTHLILLLSTSASTSRRCCHLLLLHYLLLLLLMLLLRLLLQGDELVERVLVMWMILLQLGIIRWENVSGSGVWGHGVIHRGWYGWVLVRLMIQELL